MGMAKRAMEEEQERQAVRDLIADLDLDCPWDVEESDIEVLWVWVRAQDINLYTTAGDGVLTEVAERRIQECPRCSHMFAEALDEEDAEGVCGDCWADLLAAG